jgi:AraC-like DNA-binding protein
MTNFSGFFNTIILLGAMQGFILSALLLFGKANKPSSRLLAMIIFFISLASFNLYANYQNWFGSSTLRFLSLLIPLVVVMPIGPLLYFYVRSITNPLLEAKKVERYHFLPVVIDLVPSITVLVFFFGRSLGLILNHPRPWGEFIDDFNVYADIPRWISLSCYVVLAARCVSIAQGKKLIGNHTSLNWMRNFIYAFILFQLIWLIYLIPYVTPKYTNWVLDTFSWYPVYVPLALLIYWLGIKGYVYALSNEINRAKKTTITDVISKEELEHIAMSLKTVMEDGKIYLDHQVSLSSLAIHLAYTPKTISAVLNQHLGLSFNDYLNKYRVDEFKKRVVNPEYDHFTITGIALDCGFNSQATFQRAFKDLTAQSPSAYRKQAKANLIKVSQIMI